MLSLNISPDYYSSDLTLASVTALIGLYNHLKDVETIGKRRDCLYYSYIGIARNIAYQRAIVPTFSYLVPMQEHWDHVGYMVGPTKREDN